MKHTRTLIREAVRDRLAAQLPLIDNRITTQRISIHRSTPLFASKLPAVLIYTRDERIDERSNGAPGVRYRKLELSVEIVASGPDAAEDADRLAMVVEAILDEDETFGLPIDSTRLLRTEIDQDGEGDTPILAVRMLFEVCYWTKPVEVEGVLPYQVLVSWEPEIGIPYEGIYQPLMSGTGVIDES